MTVRGLAVLLGLVVALAARMTEAAVAKVGYFTLATPWEVSSPPTL